MRISENDGALQKERAINYGCAGLTVVISGGTSGIGLAVAKLLLSDGAGVFILGRSEERGRNAEKILREISSDIRYIACDVRSSSSCSDAAEKIAALSGGSIDVLINSAGVYVEQRIESLTEECYEEVMAVNVKGTLLLIKAVKKYMGRGSIINIASDAGVSGNYGCPVYCASKGAVTALTKALALDFAPDVRVNCICPADIYTPLLERQLAAAGACSFEELAAFYPLRRIGTAAEAAHVICSAASPANSFMTGSIILVDGGLTAG